MTIPFRNSIEILSIQLSGKSIKDAIPNILNIDNFSKYCEMVFLDIKDLYLEYEIKEFKLPGYDEVQRRANETSGSIYFYRNGNEVTIEGGSNSSPYNATILLTFDDFDSYRTIQFEENDGVNYTFNSFGKVNFVINMSFENGDLDILKIKINSNFVTFSVRGIENVYIGDFPVKGSCGYRLLPRKFSFKKYAVLQKGTKNFIGEITVKSSFFCEEGVCPSYCGDGVCDPLTENCLNCPYDCICGCLPPDFGVWNIWNFVVCQNKILSITQGSLIVHENASLILEDSSLILTDT